jgi:hypothetical protein
MPKQRISYIDLDKMTPDMRKEMERCQREGTPRPESSAVRAHVPACFWFFANSWSTRASLFKVGGYSAFVVCLGLGFGAAFLGYASIKKAQSSSDEIAKILIKAISNVRITTTGEFRLLPGATLVLKPGATVGLDSTASVKLQPGETIQVQNTRPRFNSFTSAAQQLP